MITCCYHINFAGIEKMSVSIFNPLGGGSRSLRTSTASSNLKLTASSNPQPPSGPSYVTLFITNLRLLDLDLQDGWPDINLLTFSTKDAQQNQKKRIQCVEWALFHLFAIWDPEETRNKLQPFFPPLEPLQSLNLRTALFRCLDQAKKNGVLGRDTVLRKTMLDECKGERLEEVLAVFSNVVLKKAVQNDTSGRYEALAQALALENFSYTGERTILSVLILAHKKSLRRHIDEKNNLRAKYNEFSKILDLSEERTSRRRAELDHDKIEGEGHPELSDRDLRSLQNRVRKNWSGSNEWLETILYGDNRPGRDGLLAKRFDILWDQIEAGTIAEIEGKNDTGLVERLEARVQNQESRLARWQEFGRTLIKKGTESPAEKVQAVAVEEKGIKLAFNDHQKLQIGKYTTGNPTVGDIPIRDEYVRLMERTRNALNDVSKPKVLSKESLIPRSSRHKFIQPSMDSSQESCSSTSQDGDHSPLANASTDQPSTLVADIHGVVEFSTPRGHRNAPINTPRSRISHRPISTMTSSILSAKHASNELDIASERLSKVTPFALDTENDYMAANPGAMRSSRRPASIGKASDQEHGAGSVETPKPIQRRHTTTSQSSPSLSQSIQTSDPSLDSVPELSQAEQILNSMSAASPSPQKMQRSLSLAERTRLTMARSNPRYMESDFNHDFENLPDVSRLTLNPKLRATPATTSAAEEDRHADLIERTRQSMAGFEAAQKKAQLERRKSIQDEKRKQRQSHFPKIVQEEEEPLPQATPSIDREVLMDGDVDYASVFMSRPRIAVSPTPAKDRMISSMIESGDDEDKDEDEDMNVTMGMDADYANAFMSRPRIALSPTPARHNRIMMDGEVEEEGEAVNMWHDL
ncbi:1611c083-5ba5-41ea-876e-c5b817c7e3d4 [Sclerotinia trifoliorum]|uniref:1611c083-5ba5-41ea-876e-c5b817c7e3d4 n=1 Tax=Sclerotinia trifoliorum TaxID=28548 RepID=A0A8H2W3J6_9HELO|nr:1611c083-5ba5-41ea-876e-c5b817c7e3d4 [Sclerotinia trifoliorum]